MGRSSVLLLFGVLVISNGLLASPTPEAQDEQQSGDTDAQTAPQRQPQQQQSLPQSQPQPWNNPNYPFPALTRPAWPGMGYQPQPQGPYIQGYSPGAQGGYQTLPATINGPPAPQPVGGYNPRVRAMPYRAPAPNGQAAAWNPNPNVPQTRSYPTASNPWPQQQAPAVNNDNELGSLQPGASHVEEIPAETNSNWNNNNNNNNQPQNWQTPTTNTNTQPSYTMPSQNWVQPINNNNWNSNPTWNTWNRPVVTPSYGGNNWNYLPSMPQQQAGPVVATPWTNVPSSSTGMAVGTPSSGWVSGSPTWRKSYTPMLGRSGCFNKCRPNCSRGPGYGCRPSCRASCNVRPTCGARSPGNMVGNTFVCGRPNYNPWNSWSQNAGWGGMSAYNTYSGQQQQEQQRTTAPQQAESNVQNDEEDEDDKA